MAALNPAANYKSSTKINPPEGKPNHGTATSSSHLAKIFKGKKPKWECLAVGSNNGGGAGKEIRESVLQKRRRKGEAVEEEEEEARSTLVAKCTADGRAVAVAVAAVEERYRYRVGCLVAMVMCLCNADRVVMSVAVVPLAAKFGWSGTFTGIVQSSFLWGYMISSVIGGALVDKYGGKTVLSWGVALWSFATLFTPLAANHSTLALLTVRACFGLAQGVTMPAMNILLSRWFPVDERATAVGVSMAGFQLGNVVGLLLTPSMISVFGISGPFVLFSSLGLTWLTTWVDGVTNDPRECSFVSHSELEVILQGKLGTSVLFTAGHEHPAPPPIGLLFSKLPSLAVILANLTNNWGYFVLLTWMPMYFQTVLNVNLKQAAWFSAVPWGVTAFSSFVAGVVSDHLIRAGYPLTFVRKTMQSVGFIGPAVSLLCLNIAETPRTASVILTMALSLSSFSQAGFLLNIQVTDCSHFKILKQQQILLHSTE
ncbi:Probable anion transporter 3, chloroplastic [Dionaea muscipula]